MCDCGEGPTDVRNDRRHRAGNRSGFSLPELLAVLALLAIALAVGVPLVNEQIRIAEVRGAADNLAVNLRAARMISVSKHTPIKFTIDWDADRSLWVLNYNGTDGKARSIALPERVTVTPESDRLVTFQQNGSVSAPASIVLESVVPGARERWTATVSSMGIATLQHERLPAASAS